VSSHTMRARSTYSKSCSLRECGFDPLRLQDIENQSIVRFFRPSDGQKMAAPFRPTNRQLTFAARQSGASSGLPLQSEARFIAVDQTLGLGQRRSAFNRRRCAQDGHVLGCARSLRSDFISLTLGKVGTCQFEKILF
jgi:hypothetical protein